MLIWICVVVAQDRLDFDNFDDLSVGSVNSVSSGESDAELDLPGVAGLRTKKKGEEKQRRTMVE